MIVTSFTRPKSLTESVFDEIRGRIVTGQVELGSLLSEARFAKDLGVSRTPVREAFNRLEMEGLVKTEPQRGTYVFTLSKEELAKLCDARVCLEIAALKFAFASNATQLEEKLGNCIATMESCRASGDDAAYLMEDTRFHQYLLDCCDNRFLSDAYNTIAAKMAALRNRLGNHPDHMAKSFAEHRKILEAIRDRDLPRAQDVLERHIGRKEGSYWTLATENDHTLR